MRAGTGGAASGERGGVRLRLLGLGVEVKVPPGALRRGLEYTYAAFEDPSPEAEPDLSLGLARASDGAELATPDGAFLAPEGREASLYLALAQPVIRRATRYFVLHAGAVVHEESAVILCAPSGVGKSTLTLALVEAGLGFLSDELAPLRREDLRLEAFPRAVGLRQGASKRFPHLARRGGVTTREADGSLKRLVDLRDRMPPAAPQGLAVGSVFFLTPQAEPDALDTRHVELSVSRHDPGLEQELAALAGVRRVTLLSDRGEPGWRLSLDPEARVAASVDRLAQQRGLLVTRVVPAATRPPDFGAEPRLEPLGPGQGVLELARYLLNGAQSALLEQEYDSSLARLVFRLARLGARARFARLVVGRLDRMCGLVQQVLGSP